VLHPINPSFRVVMLNMMDEEVEAMFTVRAERLAAAAAASTLPAVAADE